MKIAEQLAEVQAKLKAPKGQYNDFGNYNYRSCEDILEAAKPLLKEHGLTLILDDSIESAGNGGRIYIKATARLQNADGESIENHAYAREAETKKGMDDSQITGTASSYARKYALNGLFLIDDTKDADTNQYHNQTQCNSERPQPAPQYIDEIKQTVILKELHRTGWDAKSMLSYLGKKFPKNPPNAIGHIDEAQFTFIVKALKKKPDKGAEPA
jgi:hypothetical protein